MVSLHIGSVPGSQQAFLWKIKHVMIGGDQNNTFELDGKGC